MTGEQWCKAQQWYRTEEIGFGFTAGGDMITRYCEQPPNALIDDAIAYLTGLNGCAALTMDGIAIAGTWRTALVVCAPVGPEASGRARRMRLSHTIAKVGGAAAGWAETNCTYVVTVTPYFNVAAVTSPTTGTSGITYSIEGARRDDRTGFWDYLVVKREQVTTTTGIVKTEDDKFKTISEQTFYGVRTGNLNHLNAAVALWTVGVTPDGTEYETTNVRKNDNCTMDISQRKTVAKEVAELTKRTGKDVYEHFQEVEAVAAAALGVAPVPADGVITENVDSKREDGLFGTKQRVVAEQDVADASVSTEKDVFEHTAVTEDVAATALAAAPAASGGVITRNRSDKTKGGKFKRNQTVVTEQDVANASLTTEKDIFEHTAVTEDVAATALDAAPAASGGVITRNRSDKTKGGKFKRNQTVVTEQDVANASLTTEKDIFEHTAVTEDVAATALDAAPAASGGVITRNRSDKTKGGKFKRNQTVVTEQDVANASLTTEKDIFEHTAVTEDVAATALDAAPAASGGVITRNRSDKTKGGKFKRNQTVVTEQNVAASSVTTEKNLFEQVTVTEAVGATALDAAPVPTGGLIKRHRSDKTKGGKFKTQETGTAEQAVSESFKEQTGDLFDARVRVASKNTTADATTPGLSGAGTALAKVVTVVNEKTPGGLVNPTKIEETPGPSTVETIDVPYDGDKTVKIVIFRNHTKAALQALITAAKYYRVSSGVQLNRFGLLDGTLTLSISDGASTKDGSYELITDEPYTQTTEQIVNIEGKWHKRVITYTHSVRRDWGVDDGISRYSGAKSGSEWRILSGGWYYFDKVTAISVTDTLITVPAAAVEL